MKCILIICLSLASFCSYAWQADLKKEIQKIDQRFNGEIGIVVKNLKDGSRLEYNADKRWYLSSTIKVLVAISLMEEIEAEKIRLNQKITLEERHFVDGAGPLLWSEPGAKFSVEYLLEAMLRESDNTATDILIGLIGIDEINRDIKKWMPESGEITSLLEVRYLAYSELHPKARSLNNMDFVLIKNKPLSERHIAFAEKIRVPHESLKAKDLEEAHEKYYGQGFNSASLQSYVTLLEKLENGKLLSEKSSQLILDHMEKMKTGEHRLKAGLPSEITFIQKTGTQIHRACNVGLIRENEKKTSNFAVAVCIKKSSESVESDEIFKAVAQKLPVSTSI